MAQDWKYIWNLSQRFFDTLSAERENMPPDVYDRIQKEAILVFEAHDVNYKDLWLNGR